MTFNQTEKTNYFSLLCLSSMYRLLAITSQASSAPSLLCSLGAGYINALAGPRTQQTQCMDSMFLSQNFTRHISTDYSGLCSCRCLQRTFPDHSPSLSFSLSPYSIYLISCCYCIYLLVFLIFKIIYLLCLYLQHQGKDFASINKDE